MCAPKFNTETFAPSPLDKLRQSSISNPRIAGPGGQIIAQRNSHVVNRHWRIVDVANEECQFDHWSLSFAFIIYLLFNDMNAK